MSSREDIQSRIDELGRRLADISADDKRIKKRILQKLGKLKKDLLLIDETQITTGSSKNENDEKVIWTKKQCKLKLKIANSDIAELAQKKQLKAAQKKFRWCLSKGLKPDIHTYTNLMNAYVRCKEMKGAYQVWNDMIAAKIEPNIVTFTTLIKGYSENDMISSAQSLLVDMLSGNILEGMTQPPPLPSSRTLNTFWRGCIRWGSIGSALAIFTMINEQPHLHDAIVLDETSYEYLITLLCQSFDLQTAINLTLQYLEIYSTIKSNSVLNLHWIDTENDSDLQRIINLSDVPIDTPDNIQLLLKYSITRTMNIDAILSTASIFLNLSRTFILLKKYTEIGQIFLTITENFIQETKSSSLRLAMEKRRKSEPSDTAAAGDHPPLPSSSFSGNQQRDQNQNSNSIMLFIQHRSAELSREVSLLKSYLQQSLKLKTAAAATTRGEGGGLESEIVNVEDEEMSTESLENILNGYMKTLLFYNLHELNQDNGNEQGEAEGEGKREGGHWKDQLQTGMLTQLNESFGLTNFINHFSSRKKNLKKSMITRVMKAILSSIKDNNGDKDKDKDKGSQETRSGFYIDFHSLFRHTQQSQHTVGRAGVGVKRKDPSTSSSSNQQSQSQQQQRKKKMREPSVAEEEEENDDNDQEEEEEVAELEVKMEICSGSGEWIIEQAMEYQRRRSTGTARTSASASASSLKPILWVALEIRADRVYQALTHSILRRATGQVALLGGDATVILPDLIPNNSITTIFINHPEPPERSSGGEDRSQGSHLLTEHFFNEIYRVLKSNGKLTIVTDNRLYAHSLAKTVDHINSLQWTWADTGATDVDPVHSSHQTKKISPLHSDSDSESDSDDAADSEEMLQSKQSKASVKAKAKGVSDLVPPIVVRSGDPEERGDHLDTDEGSSSYFSRMWKNGSKSRVWNLVLVKR